MIGALGGDVRFALRVLRRSPGVTAAAIVALALGIGATTAVFSVVDGVLLRPLPFPDSRALWAVHTGSVRLGRFDSEFSYPEYLDLVAQTQTLERVGGWVDGDINLVDSGAPERVLVRLATPSLLPTLAVQPQRGRNFAADETVAGRDHVALISDALWRRHFGGAGDVVGKRVQLDGAPYEIIGVLPAGLRLDHPVDVWLPLSTALEGLDVRNMHFMNVVGRQRPGASAAGIAADLDLIGQRERASWPEFFTPESGWSIHARPFLDDVVGDVKLPLFILLGAVAAVLLIACANVANLLLARAAARQRELAIRTAVGASRGRLLRQLLTESVLLSLAGGGLGVLFAAWAVDGLVALGPSLPRLTEVALDLRVLGFTAAVALGTGIGFGLVPAWSASRPDLHETLKDGMRGSSAGRGRLRGALVVTEVALSLVLLVGAGLMVRSFVRLLHVDPGFRSDHAIMLRASLPVPSGVTSDADRERYTRFFGRAVAELQKLPGVTAAGAATTLPLDGNGGDRLLEVEAYTPNPGDRPHAQYRQVTAGWLGAMRIPIVEGRGLGESDDERAMPVLLVNQAFAARYFPDGHVIGRRVRLGRLAARTFPWTTIVGIVGNVHNYALDRAPEPTMYWPLRQTRDAPTMSLVARTSGDPEALLGMARAAVATVDAAQPIFDLQPLDALLARSLVQRRFTLLLMSLFGLVALVLAAVGIYAVIAYGVTQRTQEIGIRVALGARPASVFTLVLRDGMRLVGLGLGLGLGAALALTRLASSLLFGIAATDAVTYFAIAGTLTLVAVVAMLLPARRAMRVDPIQALRAE